jgi:hypothetical protein
MGGEAGARRGGGGPATAFLQQLETTFLLPQSRTRRGGANEKHAGGAAVKAFRRSTVGPKMERARDAHVVLLYVAVQMENMPGGGAVKAPRLSWWV